MTSSIITGIIQKKVKDEGVSKAGKPYTRYVFTIDEKMYSTFDSGIGEKFKAGDNVEMCGRQNGKFWDMETMKMIDLPNNQKQLAANRDMEMFGIPSSEFAKLVDAQTETNKLLTKLLEVLNGDEHKSD